MGTTGAARGVCAGVLGSLLLISPAEAEAEPESPAVPLEAAELAVRVGWRAEGGAGGEAASEQAVAVSQHFRQPGGGASHTGHLERATRSLQQVPPCTPPPVTGQRQRACGRLVEVPGSSTEPKSCPGAWWPRRASPHPRSRPGHRTPILGPLRSPEPPRGRKGPCSSHRGRPNRGGPAAAAPSLKGDWTMCSQGPGRRSRWLAQQPRLGGGGTHNGAFGCQGTPQAPPTQPCKAAAGVLATAAPPPPAAFGEDDSHLGGCQVAFLVMSGTCPAPILRSCLGGPGPREADPEEEEEATDNGTRCQVQTAWPGDP